MNVNNRLTTHLPLVVYVVIECPLISLRYCPIIFGPVLSNPVKSDPILSKQVKFSTTLSQPVQDCAALSSHFLLSCLSYHDFLPITGGKRTSASSGASEDMLGLESIFARSLLRNSSKCDLMCRCDADFRAAVHESRSA